MKGQTLTSVAVAVAFAVAGFTASGVGVIAPGNEITTVTGSAGVGVADFASEPITTIEGSVGVGSASPSAAPVVETETETPETPVATEEAEVSEQTVNSEVSTPVVASPAAPVVAPASPVVETETVTETTEVVAPTTGVGVGDAWSVMVFHECFVNERSVAYLPATQGCGVVFSGAEANTGVEAGGGFLLPSTSVVVWTEHYKNGVFVEKRLGY